jgi:L-ascorbate metabolism protein UlaG (beta-lactamase superfamily)
MAQLTFYGQAAVLLQDGATRILIDPFLTGNPLATVQAADVQADAVIVTHAHGDHLGDALEIAKRCNATLFANYEIAMYAAQQGVQTEPMHIGGAVATPFGRTKLTAALHGSTAEIDGKPVTLGNPCGVIVTLGGKHVYHAGDTGLFGDMRLIGEDVPLDVALLPIGDRFTMGVADAVKAAGFLGAKLAVPIHYNTFPAIEADPDEFVKGCEAAGHKARIVQPGETIEF